MFWKLSLVTSAAAASMTLYMIWAGMWGGGPSFLATVIVTSVVHAVMVGPYLAFGALAFSVRSHRVISGVLFVVILVISLSVVIGLSIENEAWLNGGASRVGQRVLPFILGMAEWICVAVATVMFLPAFFILKNAPVGAVAETDA